LKSRSAPRGKLQRLKVYSSTKWVWFNSSDFKKKVKQKDGETVKESKLEKMCCFKEIY